MLQQSGNLITPKYYVGIRYTHVSLMIYKPYNKILHSYKHASFKNDFKDINNNSNRSFKNFQTSCYVIFDIFVTLNQININ